MWGSVNLLDMINHIDKIVQTNISSLHFPWLIHIMQLITTLGSPWFYTISSIVIFSFLVYKKKALEGVFLYISLFSAWGIMDYLKVIIHRSRPMGEHLTIATGYSFPSGHAMVSAAFYGFLAGLLLNRAKNPWTRRGGISLVILVFLIGFSRVYLDVHYISDVLAGWLFGSICMALSLFSLRWTRHRFQNRM